MNEKPNRHKQETADNPALRAHPSKLFVETSSRCNLSCFMCVKQTGAGCGAEGDLTPETFAALEPAFPHLDALILNGIGEPLLHPHLENFIRLAKRSMPKTGWVGFQTNGLLLDAGRALSLAEAGLDRICLSIDAVSPAMFKIVRQGGELSAVEHAFSALKRARDLSGRHDLQVGAEFVLMRNTLAELPATLEWAAERGATFALVTHMLPYDEEHASQAAYAPCTDAAIAHFNRWRALASKNGVDITRYFDVLWKYGKSPEEKRIIGFVEEMKASARQQQLFLDLKKLFALDPSWIEQMETVFDQAREVAERTGLDLRLPEIVPKEKRHCHFVEEGGAFVSWEGDVHPCYFLWHRYNCFASGWKQPVRPRIFGHLGHGNILEIWNDPAFRSFRQSVVTYDYPFCISCRLAPCDYVQTEAFEQDCHVNGEPCGSCLWCMGLFQCLR